ncbi:LacI family DNA-binding transcriptional regulator [Paenibacillus methanolicus]|uniref:LacI family transcriptional regulator n=1 Tax=Paenibacillus methanolicus TaxID=582686 RepID=A0A5S5C260_9BACL|nr:LacI family DNA-binding transcriptional regulator [Paenibacillus methanolicus]TYP73387.1 LacI family transcriptional regulator [Paenibacillus methanolicus]
MTTLKDIAKHANVSVATVSKYLSLDLAVKKETEARIQAAIKELGYVPNVVAKALKRKETFNVAVIVPKINNLYYSEITSGISQTLGKQHYNLFIYEVDQLNLDEGEILQLMRENMIAGIIFIGLFSDESFKESIRAAVEWEIPVVYANRYISFDGFPLLYPDLVQASKLGTAYLASKGRRRIALVHKRLPDRLLELFAKGYRQAIEEDGEPLLVAIEEGMELSESVIPALAENRIDGVFVLNELSAVYLAKALTKANIRIPEDMAVLSLGNSLISQISTPELTCIDLQNRELGIRSAEIILSQIRKQAFKPVTVLEPSIVERGSV